MKSYPIEQDGEVTLVAGLVEDHTLRIENLLSLQTTNGKKNASLKIISHVLRVPLGMIQSLTDLIEKDTSTRSAAQARKYLSLICQLCERYVNLINNLINEEDFTLPHVEIDKERVDGVAETKAVEEQKGRTNSSPWFSMDFLPFSRCADLQQ